MIEQKIQNGFNGDSFLDKLYEMSSKVPSFTHDDIKTEIGTILIGACDTSPVASSMVAMMIALHQDVQERLLQEILSIMPEKNSTFTIEELNKLQFLDNCLSETLRLFPITPVIARESNKPFKLKNNVIIPPDVPIIIAFRPIHMREEYWGPNAHLFDPTRFQNENIKNLPAGSYIPFSHGSRNCVGKCQKKTEMCNMNN